MMSYSFVATSWASASVATGDSAVPSPVAAIARNAGAAAVPGAAALSTWMTFQGVLVKGFKAWTGA